MALRARVYSIGLQSGTDSTYFVKWRWRTPRIRRNGYISGTKEFSYEWQYLAGNTWFIGDSGTTTSGILTYNAPSNASRIRVRIRPIPSEYTYTINNRDYTGTSWSAAWSAWSTRIIAKYVSEPSTPSVSIYTDNRYKLLAEVIDTEKLNKKITFEVYRSRGQVTAFHKRVTVNKNNNRAAALVDIGAGYEYYARCRSVNGKHVSQWSDFSSSVTTIPALPKKPTASAMRLSSAHMALRVQRVMMPSALRLLHQTEMCLKTIPVPQFSQHMFSRVQ